MAETKTIAVIDIGKTNAKVALVDAASFREIAVRTTPNKVVAGPLYPHFDTERLWTFILESLKALNIERRIDAVSVTAHGATGALVGDDGELALPVLDYEHPAPQDLAAEYRKAKPPFRLTGAPNLPGGLVLAMQFYWQARRFPSEFARAKWMLMYPQYWTFRLTGMAAGEVTSLGCHTDLWEPENGRYSDLVRDEGWERLMPPVRPAGDVLGPLKPELAAAAGLSPETPVHCGIHDSNASLLPYVLTQEPPYAVVSTGTWVVVMAMGGGKAVLDETRDTLVNVNALGNPVPSARFMGGRAFSLLGGGKAKPDERAVASVIRRQAMILPSVPEDSGPFPGDPSEWTIPRDALSPEEAEAAVAFYLALMTATCLDLIAAGGPVIVEGPFSTNPLYLLMLKAATGRAILTGETATGTSIGAACLATDRAPRPAFDVFAQELPSGISGYVEKWRRLAADRSAKKSA